MKKRSFLLTVLPWLLIVFVFFFLNMVQGFISITCMVIGIVMLIERRWPEKWGDESTAQFN